MAAPRIILSGGGTGGHIFPAIAIAKAIQAKVPGTEILFVGAEGRMEMEKIPQAGYRIIGLPIQGIQRSLSWKNLLVPYKVVASLWKARAVLKEFSPDVAIGVGGYASGPLLRMASMMGIPTVIQEQNSYPGITNKLLAPRAHRICVAYDGLEQWFPRQKILHTGNPVREEVIHIAGKRQAAEHFFHLDASRKTILVIGGSLGARSINLAVQAAVRQWTENGCQVIWQTGKGFEATARTTESAHVHVHAFIREMDLAYAAADVIVSRAGAMSISELCLVGKPCILVPSPNVAEDHQTKNAMALVNRNAALLVRDKDAIATLGTEMLKLMNNADQCASMSSAIRSLGKPGAAEIIAEEVLRIASDRR